MLKPLCDNSIFNFFLMAKVLFVETSDHPSDN